MKTAYGSGLIWDVVAPRAHLAPTPLSRDGIISAALRIADVGGIEEVSIRKVAAALDAGPMRLYGFVRSKEDLLDLMIDEVYGEIEANLASPDANGESWRDSLIRVALAYRKTAFQHDWFVDLLGGRPHFGPRALTVLETTASALSRSPRDFDAATLWSALGATNAYIFGAIRADVIDRRAPAILDTDDDAARAYLNRTFQDGHHPTLEMILAEATRPDGEKDFLWGLQALLNGVAVL